MLDSTGKLYDRMILNRVPSELDDLETEGLSEMQYGVRAGRSTLHALQEVQKRVDSVPHETEAERLLRRGNTSGEKRLEHG